MWTRRATLVLAMHIPADEYRRDARGGAKAVRPLSRPCRDALAGFLQLMYDKWDNPSLRSCAIVVGKERFVVGSAKAVARVRRVEVSVEGSPVGFVEVTYGAAKELDGCPQGGSSEMEDLMIRAMAHEVATLVAGRL